jgi:hypothetical protein
MSRWERFLVAIGLRRRYFTSPDAVEIRGGSAVHRQIVRDTFWEACAKLENGKQINSRRHRIETFRFIPGTYTEPGKGWAVWDPANKMYVAAYAGPREITVVVDPTTRQIDPKRGRRDMAHEWGHALLTTAGVWPGNWKKQHEIMGPLGL